MCINSCCAWCAQKPAQEAQLDHLIFVQATDGDKRHPHLTITRQHWLDGCIIKFAFESGVQDPQLGTARLRSEYSSLSSAFQALNNSREGSILVHDPPQVLVWTCSIACSANTKVLCLNTTALSVFAKVIFKPIFLQKDAEHWDWRSHSGQETESSIIRKQQEQYHLPCQAWPIMGSLQLCPLSHPVALKMQANQEMSSCHSWEAWAPSPNLDVFDCVVKGLNYSGPQKYVPTFHHVLLEPT